MDNLSGLGYGIVAFAIIIGVGTVVLQKFGGSIATCGTGFGFEDNGTVNTCANLTDSTDTVDPANSGWTTTNYLNTQLGTTGLSGWVPAIIALVVGMLFLGMFMSRKNNRV